MRTQSTNPSRSQTIVPSLSGALGTLRRASLLTLFGFMTLVTGCFFHASSHRGITTVPRPAATETDAQRWYAYYQDQFDAYEGEVVSPTEGSEAQRQAYQRARAEYSRKSNRARWKNFGAWVGLSFLVDAAVAASLFH